MRSIMLTLVAVMGLSACVPPPEDQESAAPKETVAVDSRELGRAYEANEVAAQQLYGNKRLEVTGTLESIELDFADDPVLSLPGINEFSNVRATFPKEATTQTSALTKGQSVTVVCDTISEVMGSPMLSDCTLKN